MARRSFRRGVTLVEVLVVLAILGTLAALIVPAVMRARASAAQAQCAHQLKQIAMAAHQAHDSHGRFPPSFGFFPKSDIYGGGNALGPLFFHLLPYLEQQDLHQKSLLTKPAKNGKLQNFFMYTHNEVQRQPLAIFQCPADPTWPGGGYNGATRHATGSYAGNHLVFGVVDGAARHVSAGGKARLAVAFPDGASQTILFAEKYATAKIAAADHPSGLAIEGGCHWNYYQATCYNPLFAYHQAGKTDPNALGPVDAADPRDSRFQVRPAPDRCNPCLPASGHSGGMNVAMGDGHVQHLSAGISPAAWWALVSPGDR